MFLLAKVMMSLCSISWKVYFEQRKKFFVNHGTAQLYKQKFVPELRMPFYYME
jgi:hypothetical protein